MSTTNSNSQSQQRAALSEFEDGPSPTDEDVELAIAEGAFIDYDDAYVTAHAPHFHVVPRSGRALHLNFATRDEAAHYATVYLVPNSFFRECSDVDCPEPTPVSVPSRDSEQDRFELSSEAAQGGGTLW